MEGKSEKIYAFCSCASGKKYKFCCKKIFREIMEAMVAAEEGKKSEALQWIAKAKEVAGDTAEVLCREAIVYSFFEPDKAKEILAECLLINPNHPRAHYLRGIDLKEQGDLEGARTAYETAIKNYPPTIIIISMRPIIIWEPFFMPWVNG